MENVRTSSTEEGNQFSILKDFFIMRVSLSCSLNTFRAIDCSRWGSNNDDDVEKKFNGTQSTAIMNINWIIIISCGKILFVSFAHWLCKIFVNSSSLLPLLLCFFLCSSFSSRRLINHKTMSVVVVMNKIEDNSSTLLANEKMAENKMMLNNHRLWWFFIGLGLDDDYF